MYIRTDLNRKDLASLLVADTPPLNVRRVSREELSEGLALSNAFVAFWGRDPVSRSEPPNVVLVRDHELRDTLAWLWTYAPDVRPVTSITALMDINAFMTAVELSERPSLNGTGNAWLGLIFAEVARSSEGRAAMDRLTLSSCTSTAAFAQARAKALGYDASCVSRLARTWSQVQSMVGSGVSVAPNAALVDLFSLLHEFEGKGRRGNLNLFPPRIQTLVGAAAADYFASGTIGESTWMLLTQGRASAAEVRNSADTSREDRVRNFQSVATEILNSPSKEERDAFLIAYLASQVSPGSMEHLHLLNTAAAVYPSAYYWYGALAGLTKQSSVAAANGGLGRRLLREISREFSVFSRPTADIDHSELQLVTESSRGDTMRSSFPGFLTVSLLPGVQSVVRQHERATAAVLDDQSTKEIFRSLERLERSLIDSQAAYDRLASNFGYKSNYQFRDSRGKKK